MTLFRLTPDFERYYDNFFGNNRNYQSERGNHNCGCMPRTNISEMEDKFLLEMSVPGIEKSHVQINVENDILTVKYNHDRNEENNEKESYIRREFEASDFERKFTLSEETDSDKISASYENGILKIEIPLKEEIKNKVSKNIEIA